MISCQGIKNSGMGMEIAKSSTIWLFQICCLFFDTVVAQQLSTLGDSMEDSDDKREVDRTLVIWFGSYIDCW